MKRLIAMIMILGMLLGLCACAEYQNEETLPTDPPGVTEAPTEAPTIPPADPTEPPTEPDPMAAYVDTARVEILKVADPDGTTSELTYRYPKVLLGSDDAKFWNGRLANTMDEIIIQARQDAKNGSVPYRSMDYSAWLSGDVLVVMLSMQLWGVDYTEYQVGLFDLNTEEELDSGELFSRYTGQRTPASMMDVLALNLGNWFDQEYQTLEPSEDLTLQREKTLAPENLEKAWLYLNPEGTLMAVVPAYTLAGTEMTEAFVELTDFSPVEVSVAPDADATLEELVTVYRSEHLVYTDSVGNDYDITATLPQVNIQTPNGRDCNWEIRHNLEEYLNMTMGYMEEGVSTSISEIGYDAWIWENTLTLIVWQYFMYEYEEYYAYVFDLETGELMTDNEVALLWNAEEDTWKAAMLTAARQTFREKYAMAPEDEFYNQQMELTMSEESVEAATLYPTADGAPMVLYRIYALAGAEYYWHQVPLKLQ